MLLWKLAWRNLWRHRTRTLIMGSAVALSYALMLLSLGISDDSHRRMGRKSDLACLPAAGRIESLGLVQHGELTWAAVLLAGRSPALAHWAPQHEVVFLRYTSKT